MHHPLQGKRVLVVEDDYFEASELAARLEQSGVDVVGPVPNVERGFEQLRSAPSVEGAILDINLGGEVVFPLADELERLAVPFIFAAGYDRDMLPPRHINKIMLREPSEEQEALVARSGQLLPSLTTQTKRCWILIGTGNPSRSTSWLTRCFYPSTAAFSVSSSLAC